MTVRHGTLLYIVLLGSLVLCSCGAGAGGKGAPPPPSISIKGVGVFYSISSPLSLPYAISGQGSFTMPVDGTGFSASSVVEWNGNPLPTQFGDSTDLAASVSSALIAAPGTATITVVDGGARSNAVILPIASPATVSAGVTQLVTTAPDGTPANGDSLVPPSISATGLYVAFQSNATNLDPGPASAFQEIYERETCIGAPPGCNPSTIRITVTFNGSAVNGHSRDSAISADGRYVAFDSSATNILPNSGVCGSQPGLMCTFIRDTCIGAPSGCVPTTTPVSVDATGAIAPGSGPAMTPDGRFIAFGSSLTVLGLGSGSNGDIFVRDTCNGAPTGCTPTTAFASASSSGSPGNQPSDLEAIGATARYVAYLSWATNMVPNETATPGIFWRDTCLGTTSGCISNTVRADVSTNGTQANQMASFGPFPSISQDGRFIAFGSNATNLTPNNSCSVPTGCANVYVRDTCTGAAGCTPSTTLVSLGNDGSIGNCSGGGSPGNQTNVSMSADGRYVSFGSISTNLTPDDQFTACGWEDIFVRDTCLGAAGACTPSTVRVSVADMPNLGSSGNGISVGNAMSADGHYIVFLSSATNFTNPPSNGHTMVYLAKTGF